MAEFSMTPYDVALQLLNQAAKDQVATRKYVNDPDIADLIDRLRTWAEVIVQASASLAP